MSAFPPNTPDTHTCSSTPVHDNHEQDAPHPKEHFSAPHGVVAPSRGPRCSVASARASSDTMQQLCAGLYPHLCSYFCPLCFQICTRLVSGLGARLSTNHTPPSLHCRVYFGLVKAGHPDKLLGPPDCPPIFVLPSRI